MDGILVIDKPAGITSHDVVARARRALNTKKIGHAGTLDPMATGVLILGVNKATRLLGHLALTQKEYDATIRFGQTTTTDDADGEITSQQDATHLTATQLQQATEKFIGTIYQVPNSISAIKIDGKRAYQRVREGEVVELKPRQITIDAIDIGNMRKGENDTTDVDVHVVCSSGTYIRALARDLGTELGTGAHLTKLRRTRVGPFNISEAKQETLPDNIIPMRTIADRCFTTWHVNHDTAAKMKLGKQISYDHQTDAPKPPTGILAAVTDTEFVALVDHVDGQVHYIAVFAS